MASHIIRPSPSRTIPCTPSPTIPPAPSAASPLPPRIQALLASLSTIKHSLSARLLLHNLSLHRGRFCLTCFRRRHTPGSCSPTCALLRPLDRNYISIHPASVSARAASLRADYAAYVRIVRAMHASRGRHVPEDVLRGWEEAVKVLSGECETLSERFERVGWGAMEERRDWERFGGWKFEGAWGRGEKEEEGVAPEVKVRGRMGKVDRRRRKIRVRNR